MLTQEELAAYFEQQLPASERVELERRLGEDPEAQLTLASQENLDLALRVLLGPDTAHDRVKQSIFTVLRGAPEQELTAHVMEEARAAQAQRPPGSQWSLKQFVGRFLGLEVEVQGPLPPVRGIFAIRVAVTLMIALCGLLFFVRLRAPAPVAIGRLTVLVGEPRIKRAGQRTTVGAPRAAEIRLGDSLETGDADRVEVQFNDGTVLRLSFNSAIEIPTPSPVIRNPKSKIQNPLWLRPPEVSLLRGQVWSKVQKVTNGTPYAVRTVVATALARGTEFGVKVSGSSMTGSGLGAQGNKTNLTAVLTVKEGRVDFFNGFGSVQATAMTESTARAGAPPSEPKRLQTLQVVQLDNSTTWSLVTSPLEWPEAASKVVGGGGDVGWQVRNVPGANGRSEVRIAQLPSGSAVARAGLRVGDALTAIDGQSLTNARQLASAILLRPSGAVNLSVRGADLERTVAVMVTTATNGIRGPSLSPRVNAQLPSLLRAWLDEPAGRVPETAMQQAAAAAPSTDLRAAAFNNLGVVFELDDLLGPAVRAYGRAVYLAPEVPLYHFNLGLALRKIGSFERAAEEFAQTVQLDLGSVPARKRVAEVQSLLGHHDEALALTESLVQLAPNDHGAWELKAQLLLKLKRPAQAAAPARHAAELDPDCPIAHAYLAEACQEAGELAEAQAAWVEVLERAPFEPAFLCNFGTLQNKLKQPAAAEQSFRRAIELRPDFALAYRNLGETLASGRRFEEAAAAFQKARELDPNDANANLRAGDMALRRRQFELAERAYRDALEIAPHDAPSFFGLGEVSRLKRRPAEAERLYRRAIELEPEFAAAYTCLGIVCYDRGNMDEAERLYRRAIELSPREAAPYHNLGTIYRESRGDLDAAERWFKQALERAPEDGESLGGLGLVAMNRGNAAEAERLLREAVQQAPDSSTLHNSLGEVLRERGRLDEAEPQYRKALELDPDNPSPYGNLGILQAERHQLAEAEKTFRALLERVTVNHRLPALVNLATVCGEQGKLEEAEKFFRQALELAPKHPRVGSSLASFLADHKLKLDEALTLATAAVAAAPNDANFLDALGWVQAQRGDIDTAKRTLQRALDLAGQEPPAAEIRVHLEKARAKKQLPNTEPNKENP
jgi:Flp pilus assembly protein TadD